MNLTDVVRELYQTAMVIPEPFSELSMEEQEEAARLLAQFEELQQAHDTVPYAELLHPMLLSKNGRFQDALTLTRDYYENARSWETAVAYANAARRAGDLDLAVTLFSAAAEYDPNDLTCWLEVGDINLERGQFTEALTAYEKALEKENSNQWALPSAFYCRHRLGITGNWLTSLREVANQEGCTCGMEGCLTEIFGGYGSSDGIARAAYLLEKAEQ
ncbi:Tetratricopeptide repeat protein [Gimesia chilikensis]|uniref:Tetratricopeptide repeat protein n=1 Tax=Gimesia chilikensis TaxID=2605989 RepID=A0A517WFH9_9PLAN|nr:tetratricopeptide repeat protein [Gimesia chilikensis]QDU04026.1 Tetratricopeptide repeat protein [Gimesia chilikensis]